MVKRVLHFQWEIVTKTRRIVESQEHGVCLQGSKIEEAFTVVT